MTLLFDAPVTLRERQMREYPPLSAIFDVVFDYLRGEHDSVLFGAHAVNVYVDPPRMTSDIDVMALNAEDLADDLRQVLAERFRAAVRVRTVAGGRGLRIYQVRKPPAPNRHLVDIRRVDTLPPHEKIDGVLVVTPAELVVLKLESYAARKHTDKGLTDKADLHRLLWAFPEFTQANGPVVRSLQKASAGARGAWLEIKRDPIEPDDDDW